MSQKQNKQFKSKQAPQQQSHAPAQKQQEQVMSAEAKDQLEQDIAFWTTKAFDLEQEIDSKTKLRQMAKEARLKELRQKLHKAKVQLKNELETNNDLTEKFSTLSVQEGKQAKEVATYEQDVEALRTTVADYEQQTRLKEDNTKMQRAYQQLQNQNELTELTVLALKVNEELTRAKQTQQQMNHK